jgi:hypothetical protein
MQLTLKIQPVEGDAYEVTTNLFTLVLLERKFKVRASDLANGIAMEHLAFLAYEAAKHSGVTVPAVFDTFIQKVRSVEVVGTGSENPTEAAVTSEL